MSPALPLPARIIHACPSHALRTHFSFITPDHFPLQLNFGPFGSPIDSVTFGRGGRSEFIAFGCFLAEQHYNITCFTPVGAGAGHSFFVVVDGQSSVAPSTNYGPPRVSYFSGPGAVDAKTDGGQIVDITGDFFSIQAYLQRVTYGPTGTEFDARTCYLRENHTVLRCLTAPGTGRKLYWSITVLAQTSGLSSNTTSYEPPVISAWAPLTGTPTQGGTPIVIRGTGFAQKYAGARAVIKLDASSPMDANGMPIGKPSAAKRAAHWDDILDGGTGDPDVSRWIAELATLTAIPTPSGILGYENFTTIAPAGFGAGRSLFVMVDGVLSQEVSIDYAPPFIARVAPERVNVSVGFLRLTVEGTSFGESAYNGMITVDGSPKPVETWSHQRVTLIVPDPGNMGPNGTVQVARIKVGNQWSNDKPFSKPVPGISSLVGQGIWSDMDTQGGQSFFIANVVEITASEPLNVTIGGRTCKLLNRFIDNGRDVNDPLVSYRINALTPEGVGKDLPVIVQSSSGAESRTLFSFSYAKPSIGNLVIRFDVTDPRFNGSAIPGARMLQASSPPLPLSPTLGMPISISGTNLGTPALVQAEIVTDTGYGSIIFHNHSLIVALLPPGDGTNRQFTVRVAGQISNTLFYSYKPPVVAEILPFTGPTLGNTLITIFGSNFGISQPVITVGGRPCAVLQPFVASALHDTLRCYSPAGMGSRLPIVVTVGGQTSSTVIASTSVSGAAVVRASWDYLPPKVFTITPPNGPTSGRALGPLKLDGVRREQGPRLTQEVWGADFGLPNATIEFRSSEGMIMARSTTADIIEHNHSYIRFWALKGYGDGLQVVVVAGGQSSIEPVMFTYDPPAVVAWSRADRTVAECTDKVSCISAIDDSTALLAAVTGERFISVDDEADDATLAAAAAANANSVVNDGNSTYVARDSVFCRHTPAECYDTRGGYYLEIIGENMAGLAGASRVFASQRCCCLPRLCPADHGSRITLVSIAARSSLVAHCHGVAFACKRVSYTPRCSLCSAGDHQQQAVRRYASLPRHG